jgi:F-type H+-transporting ATPase subunit epsilon
MANKLFLDLVSPERLIVSAEVDEIYAPGSEGDLGILPQHAALFCSLRSGEFRYTIDDKTEYVALDGGFLEVIDDRVTVLADGAELGAEIDLAAAINRKIEAEKALEDARRQDNIEFTLLEAKLKRELVRMNVAEHYSEKQS